MDYNGDGRPDLYVANDEDPNQLYENVAWPGGAKADPARLGFRFEERAAAEGVDDPFAGMGVAVDGARGLRSRRDELARASPRPRSLAWRSRVHLLFATPGLDSTRRSARASRAGAPPGSTCPTPAVRASSSLQVPFPSRASRDDAEAVRVLCPASARPVRLGARNPRAERPAPERARPRRRRRRQRRPHGRRDQHGRRQARAPRAARPERALARREALALRSRRRRHRAAPDRTRAAEQVRAGQQLSLLRRSSRPLRSRDGDTVDRVTVRYPWGARPPRIAHVPVDRVVEIAVPAQYAGTEHGRRGAAARRLHAREPARSVDRAVLERDRGRGAHGRRRRASGAGARPLPPVGRWVGRVGGIQPEGARLLRHREGKRTGRSECAGGGDQLRGLPALLWRVSFGSNLDRTFALLAERLRSLCYSPRFTSTAGASPAALGNRIAAAAIAYGRHDGSLEALHYTDPSYVSANQPLVLSQAGSTVHDATFWQPLALGSVAAHGLASIPAQVQGFVGAQWGGVRGFALPHGEKNLPLDPGPPPFRDPTAAAYRQAAVDAIRATAARTGAVAGDSSPLAWNVIADSLREKPTAAGRLGADVALEVALNGALHDAAIAAWGAKRAYQSPRPISMIRYLAFQGQSSDPKDTVLQRRRTAARPRPDRARHEGLERTGAATRLARRGRRPDRGPLPGRLGAGHPLGSARPDARVSRLGLRSERLRVRGRRGAHLGHGPLLRPTGGAARAVGRRERDRDACRRARRPGARHDGRHASVGAGGAALARDGLNVSGRSATASGARSCRASPRAGGWCR